MFLPHANSIQERGRVVDDLMYDLLKGFSFGGVVALLEDLLAGSCWRGRLHFHSVCNSLVCIEQRVICTHGRCDVGPLPFSFYLIDDAWYVGYGLQIIVDSHLADHLEVVCCNA